jgi:hypothetical protein
MTVTVNQMTERLGISNSIPAAQPNGMKPGHSTTATRTEPVLIQLSGGSDFKYAKKEAATMAAITTPAVAKRVMVLESLLISIQSSAE